MLSIPNINARFSYAVEWKCSKYDEKSLLVISFIHRFFHWTNVCGLA